MTSRYVKIILNNIRINYYYHHQNHQSPTSDTAKSQTSQITLHLLKVKIFCGLHNPAGFYKLYHSFIMLLIFVNSFAINLVLDFDLDRKKQTQLTIVLIFNDFITVTIIIVELALRLYVANCIEYYRGLNGIYKYFCDYKLSRLYDVFCVIILIIFLCMQQKAMNSMNILTDLRILHLFLLFQLFRMYTKVFINFANVVSENIRLIVMSIFLYIVMLMFISYIVYLIEFKSNSHINSIFDSTWFSYISLSTIGYGDVIINSPITKVITAVLIMAGLCVFTLPASIVGSALAMRLQEKRQKILCLHPAANLLQKTWRFYAIHRKPNYWEKFVLKQTVTKHSTLEGSTFNNEDKQIMYFICKVSYLLAQNRFKYANLVYNTGSVPIQYVDLQRKIELINALVRKNKGKIELLNQELRKMWLNLIERRKKIRRS